MATEYQVEKENKVKESTRRQRKANDERERRLKIKTNVPDVLKPVNQRDSRGYMGNPPSLK